jgi:AAA domain (dynein-related subfamily)
MTNALNLQEIDQEQAQNLARFFIRANQNIFLFGRRGIGKSFIAMQAAKDCGFKLNYINLSVIERPDLAGYPDMHAEGDVISYKSPYFLPKLAPKEKPNCVLLFDEVDKAPPEITAPLLEILQFGQVNGQPINVVSCILTGNLMSEGSHSNEISSALLDRGAKYILSFSFEKWLDWAQSNAVHDLVLGFLTSNPELACGELENTCYASPSPRGWTMVSDVLIKAKKMKMVDIETIFSLVSGFVGYQAGVKFRMWYEYYRKFEPHILSLIETGECPINFAELGPTEKIVFCITACHLTKARFVQESKSQPQYQYVERLVKFIKDNKVEPEVQRISLNNSFSFEFIADKRYQLYNCKPFMALTSKLGELVKAKR